MHNARTTVQGPESWPRKATCLLRQPLPELMHLCCTQWQNRFRERFQSPGSRLPTDGLGISNSFIPTSWIGGQWLFFHTLFMYARPATRFRCCVVYCKGYVKKTFNSTQARSPRTLKQLHTNTTTELFCLRIATLGLEAKTPTATPHDQDPSPFLVLQWRKEQCTHQYPSTPSHVTYIYLAYAGIERTMQRVRVLLLDRADTEFHGPLSKPDF
jgi:hypothetical protein